MNRELFESVKDGKIQETEGFQVSCIENRTDASNLKKYRALLAMIVDGHIDGIRSADDEAGPNYRDLKVTKSGLEYYRILTTPINDILKPTLWETCRNAVIGKLAGNAVLWLLGIIMVILIPTFNEDARKYLEIFCNYLFS